MLVWDRRKYFFYGNRSVGEVNQNNPTPECEVNGTDPSAMMVECVSDLFNRFS